MTAPTIAVGQPEITDSPRRFVLFQHHSTTQSDLKATLARSFGDLYARINQSGVAPVGPPFVVYHNMPEQGGAWEIDVCAPISEPISGSSDFKFMEMPEGRVVSLMHVGPYETLGAAYAQLSGYIVEHGFSFGGPPREFYFSEPDVPPQEIQTLIEWPIV